MNANSNPNHEKLILDALAQSQSNAAQLTDLKDTVSKLATQVSKIAEFFDKKINDIQTDSRPNFATWAAWAGVIVMFLTPLFLALHEEILDRDTFNRERMEWVDRLAAERDAVTKAAAEAAGHRLDRLEDEAMYERLAERLRANHEQ